MQPSIGADVFFAWLVSGIAWLFNEILTTANIVYTAMQIPAVVGAGFAAWWVHDFVHPLIEERIRQSSANPFSKMILLKLSSLVFPVLWALGLAFAIAVAVRFGWPYNVVRIAINLLGAWTVISLASIAVRNPVWSKTIMIAAYTIAVLNILDLLAATLALLDSLAVPLGSLRISLLPVLRGCCRSACCCGWRSSPPASSNAASRGCPISRRRSRC